MTGIWGKAMATVIRKTRKRRQDLREGGHKPDFCEPRKAQGLKEHAGPQEELPRSTWPWIMSVNSSGVAEGILPRPGGSSYAQGGLAQYQMLNWYLTGRGNQPKGQQTH